MEQFCLQSLESCVLFMIKFVRVYKLRFARQKETSIRAQLWRVFGWSSSWRGGTFDILGRLVDDEVKAGD